jgi:hypothetical protein
LDRHREERAASPQTLGQEAHALAFQPIAAIADAAVVNGIASVPCATPATLFPAVHPALERSVMLLAKHMHAHRLPASYAAGTGSRSRPAANARILHFASAH